MTDAYEYIVETATGGVLIDLDTGEPKRFAMLADALAAAAEWSKETGRKCLVLRIAKSVDVILARPKRRRGFAVMSPEKQAEIARLGGKAAHARGTAHEFTSEEARRIGRLGGLAAQRARRASGTGAAS